MTMRILALQHHPTAPAGLIGERMAMRGASVTLIAAEHGAKLPADALEHDGLLILGGAMDALADDLCPHFPALLALAHRMAEERRPVLGICLGGQLLARAWGAAVHLREVPEFGMAQLWPTSEAGTDPLLAGITGPVPAMQWHADRFDLPPGSVALLEGEACRHQAFRVADCAWAFQCHLEVDRPTMLGWAAYRRDHYGMPDESGMIAAQAAAHGAKAEAFGRHVADRWLDVVERGARERG